MRPSKRLLLRHLISALSAGLFLALTSPAIADPVIISDEDRPDWLSVGRVNMGGFNSKSMCTGVLISPTQVLTAAHCVANPKDGVPHLAVKIKFVAAWHRGDYAAVGTAKEIHIHPEYGTRRVGSFAKIELDIALITLTEPMDGVTPSPVNMSGTPFKEGPVKMFGYRVDRPYAVTDYKDCSAYVLRKSMLSIDCDVVQGTSGAPVFAQRDGVWEVVGIVSSRLTNRGRDKALAALVDTINITDKVDVPAVDRASNP